LENHCPIKRLRDPKGEQGEDGNQKPPPATRKASAIAMMGRRALERRRLEGGRRDSVSRHGRAGPAALAAPEELSVFGTTDLALFVVAGLLLNITPGPDTLYILGRSTSQGWCGGVVAALGIGAGLFVHTIAAAVGLSALLVASATAFTVLKWIGAAYLVYVGLSLLFARAANEPRTSPPPGAAANGVPPGLSYERSESQDSAILSSVPPAVRRSNRVQ
jgi:hypothetical protein